MMRSESVITINHVLELKVYCPWPGYLDGGKVFIQLKFSTDTGKYIEKKKFRTNIS